MRKPSVDTSSWSFGISGWDPGGEERVDDEWRDRAATALVEGLRAVAGHVEGG